MEAASEAGDDQCANQVNLRNRNKRLSPVYADENFPSKRRRGRKYSDCPSTSTVTQDLEPMTSPQAGKINYQIKLQASNFLLLNAYIFIFDTFMIDLDR